MTDMHTQIQTLTNNIVQSDDTIAAAAADFPKVESSIVAADTTSVSVEQTIIIKPDDMDMDDIVEIEPEQVIHTEN